MGLCKTAIVAILLFFFSSTTLQARAAEQDTFYLSKILNAQIANFESPIRIYKTKQGTMWLFFERHITIVADGFSRKVSYKSISNHTRASTEPRIAQNDKGIYISFGSEVLLYSIEKDTFIPVKLKLKKNDQVVALSKDSHGNIWVASYLTLSKIVAGTDIKSFAFPKQFIDVEVGSPLLYSAQFSPSDELYLGTYSFGLLKFHEQRGFSLVSDHFKIENTIETMVYTNQSFILGTATGAYLFDPVNTTVTPLFPATLNQKITKLAIDSLGNVFLASKDKLWRADAQLQRLTHIQLQAMDNLGSNSNFDALFVDNEDIVWLAIKDNGLFSHHPLRHKLLKADLGIAQQVNSQTLIKSAHPHYVISNKKSTYLSAQQRTIDHPSHSYLQMEQDIYLGSNGYIVHIDRSGTEHIIEYAKGFIYPDEQILHLAADKNRRIWVVSEKSGLNVFSPAHSTFKSKEAKGNNPGAKIPPNIKVKVRFIKQIDEDTMLLATIDSLYSYDTNTSTLTLLESFSHQISNVQPLDNADNKLVLFAEDDTVFIYDWFNRELAPMTFAVDNIGCLLKLNDTWLIAQKNGRLYAGKENRLVSYTNKDGLPSGGLNGKSCFSLNGSIYFSGYDGLYAFNPSGENLNMIAPTTHLHAIHVNDKSFMASAFKDNHMIIEEADLPISFNLASSSFVNTQRNQYQYRFKNRNSGWQNFDAQTRQVRFSALSPGTYQIEFKSSNNDGYWSEVVPFTLEVKPPIWLSIWAQSLYVIIVLLLGYLFYAQRLKTARNQAAKLQQLVDKRTKELNIEKQHIETLLSQKEQELIQVSHELRTPITLISGPIGQVIQSTKDQQDKTRLEMAQKNCQRLSRIVDQLIHLDRFRLQKNQQMVSQNAAEIVRFVVASFANVIESNQIKLHLNSNPDCLLMCVPDALEKMLVNLLSNAVKYCGENGEIEVDCRFIDNGSYQIAVNDNGIGISQADLPHLFNTFYRVNDEYNQRLTGAGVGLALVKELIEFHSGTIEVTSELGSGSRFALTFARESITSNEASGTQVNGQQLKRQIDGLELPRPGRSDIKEAIAVEEGKILILIIEDSPDMQRYLVDVLSTDYNCLVRSNGHEGLTAALEQTPDLILTDVMMPVMDGFEVTQALKDDVRTSHIPIIILTARGDRDSRLQGWKALADEYLAKPFDNEELLLRVDNLLTIRALMRQRNGQTIALPEISKNDAKPELNTKDQEFIERFEGILQQQYSNPDFSIDDIADNVFMSKRQLQRKIKSLFDYTPTEYLRVFRLKQAYRMICEGAKIIEVSQDAGFASHSYFGRCFKAHFDCTPSQLQLRCQNQLMEVE